MIRLQGKEWHDKKNELKLLGWSKSKKGNYCGFYKDKENNGFYHWMNDDEKGDFLPLTRLYPQWVYKQEYSYKEVRDIMEEIKSTQF